MPNRYQKTLFSSLWTGNLDVHRWLSLALCPHQGWPGYWTRPGVGTTPASLDGHEQTPPTPCLLLLSFLSRPLNRGPSFLRVIVIDSGDAQTPGHRRPCNLFFKAGCSRGGREDHSPKWGLSQENQDVGPCCASPDIEAAPAGRGPLPLTVLSRRTGRKQRPVGELVTQMQVFS